MPNISEYTSTLAIPQYQPTNYSPELEIQVALHHQQNYNKMLDRVKGLQSQALNIQMLNNEGRQRLNQYNKAIEEELSGDLGDLNKAEVQNKVASVFQDLAGDTSLVKASQLSGEYQKQLDTIEAFRSSGRKDRGYNSINETVFQQWDGGLYDFMGSDLSTVTSPTFRPIKYTPFKELDTKMLNIAKTLHSNKSTVEGASGNEGYILHQELEEVSPERIREVMLSTFDQEDLEQLDVMAKYEVIKNRQLGTLPDFYQKYNSFANQEIKRSQNQSSTKRQQAEYYTSLINKKETSQEDKVKYTEIVNRLIQEADLYADQVNKLNASKKNYSDFEKMSNQELLEYASAIQWSNKINGISDALSWKHSVDTLKLDQVWKVNKEIDAMKWREQVRAATKLSTSRAGTGKQQELPEMSGPIDAVKRPESFIDSYQKLEEMTNQYGKLSDNIITSPSFVPNQLLNEGFLKTNKDNYEIKMWDLFVHENPTLAIKNGTPQIEAFKVWLKDQEANPTGVASQYVEEQTRNKGISDWLDLKVTEINRATRSKVNEFDELQGYPLYKQDGTTLTREEYNAGVPVYISVPTDKNKTSYQLLPLEEVKKESKRLADKYVRAVVITPRGVHPDLWEEYRGSIPETEMSYLTNDKGLYRKVLKIARGQIDVNKQLEAQMIGQLPQIFQMPLVEAMNDEAKMIWYPDVVSAAKNTNEGKSPVGQFGISMNDIAFIRPPTTGEWGQFQLKPEPSKNFAELGWKLPDAAEPTKMIDIVPGGTYSFRTNKPYMPYDILYNEMVKDIPIEEGYKGYKIRISKSKTSGNTTAQVFDPKGQIVNGEQQTTNQQVDVSKLLKSMKDFVDTQVKK